MQNKKLEQLVDFKGRGSEIWGLDSLTVKAALGYRDVLVGAGAMSPALRCWFAKFRASLEAIARSPAQAASHAAVFALPRLGRAPDGLPEPANRLPANE